MDPPPSLHARQASVTRDDPGHVCRIVTWSPQTPPLPSNQMLCEGAALLPACLPLEQSCPCICCPWGLRPRRKEQPICVPEYPEVSKSGVKNAEASHGAPLAPGPNEPAPPLFETDPYIFKGSNSLHPRKTLNFSSFCLCLPSPEIGGVYHHTQLCHVGIIKLEPRC